MESYKKRFKDKCSANKCASKICDLSQSMTAASTLLESQNSTGVSNLYLRVLASQGNRGTLLWMPPDRLWRAGASTAAHLIFFLFSWALCVCVIHSLQAEADNNPQKMVCAMNPHFWDFAWKMQPIGTKLRVYQNRSKILKIKHQLLVDKSAAALMAFRTWWVLAIGSSLMR